MKLNGSYSALPEDLLKNRPYQLRGISARRHGLFK
jgi:hypothetical protein